MIRLQLWTEAGRGRNVFMATTTNTATCCDVHPSSTSNSKLTAAYTKWPWFCHYYPAQPGRRTLTCKCVGLLFFIPTKKSNFSDFRSTFWSMLLFCMWWCGIPFGAGYFFEARLDSVVRTTFWAGQEYFLPRLNPYSNPRW